MHEKKKICPFCGTEMALHYTGWLTMQEKRLLPVDYMQVQLYLCPRCRFTAWFKPLTPIEILDREQQAKEGEDDPVKKFERGFAGYSVRKLQKIIDSKDYLPEAKKAAKNLLRDKGE